MLLLSAAFAVGIAVGSVFAVGVVPPLIVCGILAVSALAFARHKYVTLIVVLAFFAAGSFVSEVQLSSITPDRIRSLYDDGSVLSGEPVEISGTIIGNIEVTPDGFFMRVETDSMKAGEASLPASGVVRLFASISSSEMAADYERLDLHNGDRVRIPCELSRDDGYRNPGVLSRKTILDWQDLDATGTIKSPLLIEKMSSDGSRFSSRIFDIRSELIAKFRELFSPQTAGVMIASLLGNKHFLNKETADVFREGGTFHILVISGLHITFIGGLAALIVGWFTRRKGIQFVIVCSFLWMYTIAVGAEVPVVRASLMFTVLWFSFVIHRQGSLANALGTCVLILLVWRPNDLFTPSFQLTFVSVSAIVLAAFPLITTLRKIGEWSPTAAEPFPANVPRWLSRCCETLYWNPKRWEIDAARNVWSANLFKAPFFVASRPVQSCLAWLFEGVLVSLIVQIAMLPLVVHYFHRVTPMSVPLNLWAGFFIALESFATLFAVVFSYLSESLALPFIYLTETFHWLLVSVPAIFSDSRLFSFRVPVYSGVEGYLYAAYFIAVSVLAFAAFLCDPFKLASKEPFARFSVKPVAVSVAILCGLIVFHPLSEPVPDGRLHVEFLDVGQGDSAFITFPNGETMLIDGGGRPTYRNEDDEPFEPDVPSIGEMVVSEFLWEKGYSQIDHLVSTHADADHIQGLSDVAGNFSIGQAWFGLPQPEDPDQIGLTNLLSRHNVPMRSVVRGDRFEIAGTLIEVLSPPASGSETWKENDRSLVLRFTYGSISFLLTGDIEKLAESDLTSSGLDLTADVIKVPHHGSRTSSTASLVENVKPRFAIILVGRQSMFGHPHPEVVERWKAAGAEIATTGENGTISFSTDGNGLVVKSFVRNSE